MDDRIQKWKICIKIENGEKIIFRGVFDMYQIELKNPTDSAMDIKGLSFQLPAYTCKTSVHIVSGMGEVKSLHKGIALEAHGKKIYSYQFIKPKNFPKNYFISLKPFLTFKQAEIIHTLILPNVIYYTTFFNNKELVKILKTIEPVF
jgi:hypothetical protein